MLRLILLFSFIAIAHIFGLAQTTKPIADPSEKTDQRRYSNPTNPIVCEEALLYLEDAVLKARKTKGANLIFINHPGKGESLKTANIRLKQEKAWASRFDVPSVFAIGEPVKGNGVLNLYLEGRLLYSLPLFKNDGLNLIGGCID